MQLRIRPAKRRDIPTILKLIRDLAQFEKLSHEVQASPRSLEASLFPKSPAARRRAPRVLMAEQSGKSVGFALYFYSYSTFLARPGVYLEDLYVRPKFRSLGIGKALLSRLAHEVIAIGGGRLEWSVLKWNRRAISFYKRLGATPQKSWQVYRMAGPALKRLARSASSTS